jgi:hypothetical protein
MVKCSECKWWNHVDAYNEPNKYPLGMCDNPKWMHGYSYKESEIPIDGIWIENDEDWGCFTGSNFSCIHGEKKD